MEQVCSGMNINKKQTPESSKAARPVETTSVIFSDENRSKKQNINAAIEGRETTRSIYTLRTFYILLISMLDVVSLSLTLVSDSPWAYEAFTKALIL